jgi:phenylpropionate dioxygenase-like ring-hydroxylating dioxygenase large terminal subunit
MIADIPPTKAVKPQIVTTSIQAPVANFNWKHYWYPIAFVRDLPNDRPYSFSLYDEPLVLFRDREGKLACLSDRCCHRPTRLSDGKVINGRVECSYHGWQYDAAGKCVSIPQLPATAKIPRAACVPSFLTVECQGIVWVWLGDPQAATPESIPTLGVLEELGFVHSDFMLDLPYDYTYLVENLLDPAHIYSSHSSTVGKKDLAQPLEMEIAESSDRRIYGKWRRTQGKNEHWHEIDCILPGMIHLTFNLGMPGKSFGLAYYCLPLGKGQCRVLVRIYRNFFAFMSKLVPRWLSHLLLNKVFEEDLPLLVGQQTQTERLGCSIKELYLPLQSCDLFAIAYRKWLDKVGADLPFYDGYATFKGGSSDLLDRQRHLQDRFSRHTSICQDCDRAHRIAIALKQLFIVIAIGFAALAIAIDGTSPYKLLSISASLLAVTLAVIAHHGKLKFEHSHKHF